LNFSAETWRINSHDVVEGDTDTPGVNFRSVQIIFRILLLFNSLFLSCFHFYLFLNSFILGLDSCLIKAVIDGLGEILLKKFNSIEYPQLHFIKLVVSFFLAGSQRLTSFIAFVFDEEDPARDPFEK